jgi:hypothetical protein
MQSRIITLTEFKLRATVPHVDSCSISAEPRTVHAGCKLQQLKSPARRALAATAAV